MNTRQKIVCSSGRISCSTQRVWDKVCFYEHIATKPSLLLRTVLPVPQRTTGSYSNVGDVSRCMYSDGGYLTKQITAIVRGEHIDFDIIEQSIRYSKKIILKGGTIRIEAKEDGSTLVRMLTRYEIRGVARLIPRIFIDFVIGAMHRIVLRDMQARLAPANVTTNDSTRLPGSALKVASRC